VGGFHVSNGAKAEFSPQTRRRATSFKNAEEAEIEKSPGLMRRVDRWIARITGIARIESKKH
jgi:hypothetical protein